MRFCAAEISVRFVGHCTVNHTRLLMCVQDSASGAYAQFVAAMAINHGKKLVLQVPATEMPEGWRGLDIGPKTVQDVRAAISRAQTILWNGPVGVYEWDAFAVGAHKVAKAMASRTSDGGTTIVCGNDCVAAVKKAGVADSMSHVSTGGDVSLKLVEGMVLPAIAALDNA